MSIPLKNSFNRVVKGISLEITPLGNQPTLCYSIVNDFMSQHNLPETLPIVSWVINSVNEFAAENSQFDYFGRQRWTCWHVHVPGLEPDDNDDSKGVFNAMFWTKGTRTTRSHVSSEAYKALMNRIDFWFPEYVPENLFEE